MSVLATELKRMYWQQSGRYNPIIRDGLVIYAPLDQHADNAYTGQPLYYTNSHDTGVYGTYKGIPCRTSKIDSPSGVSISEESTIGVPTGSGARTVAFWYCRHAINTGATLGGWGEYASQKRWSMCEQTNTINLVVTAALNPSPAFKPVADTWMHLAFWYNGRAWRIYRDGIVAGTGNITLNTSKSNVNIMGGPSVIVDYRMAGWRLYNRALSDSEILQLAHEFTPTT